VYEFEDDQDKLIPGVVQPKLLVAWSRRRAWHLETVTIQVRSELVKDGTEVKLEVQSHDGKVSIVAFEKETITGNKLDKEYKIDWKDKKLKEEPYKFVVKATVKDPPLTAESADLAVDLSPPLFSA